MWQNEIGFLELFLAYFEQYKNSLAYGKKHRDFLMEILLCHERVIRHCGLIPGLNDYQTDLDGMPVLEPQVIVVEHCDDPENMGSDMVVTKLERLPTNDCDSPAVFSLELPFKGAVEEDGQRGLRVDQLPNSRPCKTELPDDDSTHMDTETNADIDAEDPLGHMWDTIFQPKQEVMEPDEDDLLPEETPTIAPQPPNEKLTCFPPTSVSSTADEYPAVTSEDECDDFEGPNCQDQPPIYDQVSTASVMPASQRQPLFASMQGQQLYSGVDERSKVWGSVGEREPSAQPELRLPSASDLSRMVSNVHAYVKNNTPANRSTEPDETPPAKKPTLDSSVSMPSCHTERTAEHPLPPGVELSMRADDCASRRYSTTPSTSPAVDHSISSVRDTPSPQPAPAASPPPQHTPTAQISAPEVLHTPTEHPPASQLQHAAAVQPTATHMLRNPAAETSAGQAPASQMLHTGAATPVTQTGQAPTAPSALHPLRRMLTSLPSASPAPAVMMRQESAAASEQRPTNAMTTTTAAASDPQNRRSYICSRCRRLFRSYELFTRHPCITAFAQDPMNGKTGGAAGQATRTNIFPNRDVFATKLQHDRYQQHLQSIIAQQQHFQQLQQPQQPQHLVQPQQPFLMFSPQQQMQPRAVATTRQQTALCQQPVQDGQHQMYHQALQQRQHQLQDQQMQQQQPYRLVDPAEKQVVTSRLPQQQTPPGLSKGQMRAQTRQQELEEEATQEERSACMFRCRMCQRSFFRAGDRMRHERTHASNRRCQWCGKEYARPSTLRHHETKCPLKPPETVVGTTEHSPPLLVSRARVA